MGCGAKTVKILLIVFNIIFWLCGLGILGVGIWIKVDQNVVNAGNALRLGSSEPIVEIITWIFIGAGIFVFAVGFFGCCGAIRESKIMLGFYMICIFLVFVAEVGAGIYAGVRKDAIKEQIKLEGKNWIKTAYNGTDVISKGFNYVQLKYKCCGVTGFMDYDNSTYVVANAKDLQNSVMSFACCKTSSNLESTSVQLSINPEDKLQCIEEARAAYERAKSSQTACTQDSVNVGNFFYCQGCYDKLAQWAEEHMVTLIAVGIAFGAVQLILFFLALWFCRVLGNDEK